MNTIKNIDDTLTKDLKENTKPSLLYIENDQTIIDIVRLFLGSSFDFNHALTGEEGIELAKQKYYSAILMDINLGDGINGLEAANIIKDIPEYKTTPIIAATAYSINEVKDSIPSEKGCTHILPKPFSKAQLMNMLNNVVSGKKDLL